MVERGRADLQTSARGADHQHQRDVPVARRGGSNLHTYREVAPLVECRITRLLTAIIRFLSQHSPRTDQTLHPRFECHARQDLLDVLRNGVPGGTDRSSFTSRGLRRELHQQGAEARR